jgi:nicotinate-nucleotide adenylyltransferase
VTRAAADTHDGARMRQAEQASRAAATTGPARARVGLLGGTFDPVHIGHLIAANEAVDQLGLDQVLFVPAATPPHKIGVTMSPASHRLAMLELAIADRDEFVSSRIDMDRDGPHFTVDLLRMARRQLELDQTDDLWFVMGGDSLVDLPSWRDPSGIVALARLAVAARPGYDPDLDALERVVPGLPERVDVVEVPLIGVSGSEIRQRVRDGRSIRYQVTPEVEAYVYEHDLYSAK